MCGVRETQSVNETQLLALMLRQIGDFVKQRRTVSFIVPPRARSAAGYYTEASAGRAARETLANFPSLRLQHAQKCDEIRLLLRSELHPEAYFIKADRVQQSPGGAIVKERGPGG